MSLAFLGQYDMKCKNCESLYEIKGFGGEMQYISTLEAMIKNTENGFFRIIVKSVNETVFECMDCHTRWMLAAPDFPAEGYFICT